MTVLDLEPGCAAVSAMRAGRLSCRSGGCGLTESLSVDHFFGILVKALGKPLVLLGLLDQPSFHGRGGCVRNQAPQSGGFAYMVRLELRSVHRPRA
jgi:hypothetical protein